MLQVRSFVCVVDVKESTNAVDAETSAWTTVTGSPDASPPEVPRTAAVRDDRLDRIEAVVVTDGDKNWQGNGIAYFCLCMLNVYILAF